MKPVKCWAALAICCSLLLLQAAHSDTAVPAPAPLESYCEWKANDYSISEPLCDLKGNAERGRTLVIDRKIGNCLACHQMPIPEEEFHGTIAPPLIGVGGRYTAGQLRIRLVDIKLLNPASLMPSFYKNPDNLQRVAKEFQGRPPLTAQQVEDIVAYLDTLK